MINCPLLEKLVKNRTCSRCMYESEDGECLNKTVSTTEFALLKGVSAHDVEKEKQRAEQRIKQGLCLHEYLQWVRESYPLLTDKPDCAEYILEDSPVLTSLNVTIEELCTLSLPDAWEEFQLFKGSDLLYRVSQVLLITDTQYQQLYSSLKP